MQLVPNSRYYRTYQRFLEINKDGQLTISCHPLSYHTKRSNMKMYRQLTFEDRIYIEVCHWQRMSFRAIAKKLNVHASTVSREFKRGATGWLQIGYRADLSQKKCRTQTSKRGRKAKITDQLGKLICEKIKLGWSPEQISGRFKIENVASISHETIYRFIRKDRDQGGNLYLYLRHGKRRRKKRFSIPRVRTDILARKHIEQRPTVINERSRIGDWERDLMFGDSRKAALLVFVERKSKFTLLHPVVSKSPHEIAKITVKLMSQTSCKSITNDNGLEFRSHEFESKRLNIPIYFTRPYSSWEKGTCENTNGLIRQYFEKDFPMEEMTNERAIEIQNKLNTRPRKGLGFRTPMEVFNSEKQKTRSSDC